MKEKIEPEQIDRLQLWHEFMRLDDALNGMPQVSTPQQRAEYFERGISEFKASLPIKHQVPRLVAREA